MVIELAREEHAMSRWGAVPFDPQHVAGTAERFRRSMGTTLMVSAGGYIAGVIQDMGFSPVRMAVEYAWYARDGSGLRLLMAFEQWAKNMGAKHVVVHAYARDDRVHRVLAARRKYLHLGGALVKELES